MEQAIANLIDTVPTVAYTTIFKWFIIGIILVFVKRLIDRIVGYINFHRVPYASINARVNINGADGKIVKIGLDSIVVKTHQGLFFIDTSRWTYQEWIFRNGNGD